MSSPDPKVSKDSYIVAGYKSWNLEAFEGVISKFPGQWSFVKSPEDLTEDFVKKTSPKYIFFLHWSWKVPQEIVDQYECICFHMTDVPYGRGGSPLQNLIIRGHSKTVVSALRMSQAWDAGPVYLKELLLLDGRAEEIYRRANDLSVQMIRRIIEERPIPTPQTGEVVIFKRRKPEQSGIPPVASLDALHNFIRMLDAEGYPHAFLEYKGFRYEFQRAEKIGDSITAQVRITPLGKDNP
jgi:methionyl-tRNA formyltransferase